MYYSGAVKHRAVSNVAAVKFCVLLFKNGYRQIVAAATINFSLARVQLLIKGGSYLRVAFFNFGLIPHSVVHKNGPMKG